VGRRSVLLAAGLCLFLAPAWYLAHRQAADARRHRFESAIDRGDVQTVRECLDAGEPVNGYPNDYEYLSPLEQAAAAGQDAVVVLLLDRGANPRVVSGWGTPMSEAAEAGQVSTLRLLLDHEAEAGRVSTLRLLLDHEQV
jgi:ankyrin repeat protein